MAEGEPSHGLATNTKGSFRVKPPRRVRLERNGLGQMTRKKIGRYIVKGILGEGAMGTVYAAHDPNLERRVAIKTMRFVDEPSAQDEREFKQRFFHESRISGRLSHSHIVAIFDSGIEGDAPFLVMECIEGEPLDSYLQKNPQGRFAILLALLPQVASALDYAHEEGVIHRDIKPGNILVSGPPEKPIAKLVDFGLAKVTNTRITQPNYFIGTPSYTSPEQIKGGKLDYRSDLYALGTVAYEMLMGRLPFDSDNVHTMLYQIVYKEPELDLSRFKNLMNTEKIAFIFRKVLAKDPDSRYPTASTFVSALDEQLEKLAALPKSVRVKITEQPHQEASKTQSEAERLQALRARIQEARSQYMRTIQTANFASIRYCLGELQRLRAVTAAESRALSLLSGFSGDSLEEILQAQVLDLITLDLNIWQKDPQRFDWILKTRIQFQNALLQKRADRCRRMMMELERLLKVNVDCEKKAFEQLA